MRAFLKYLGIQLKMDLRDRGTLLNFYLVPLLFFFVMGGVFSAAVPIMKPTLTATMTIFAITMGAVMGTPAPLVKMRESGTLRAFKVNGVPGPAVLSVQVVSAFLHLLLTSVIIYAVSPLVFHADIPQQASLYFVVLAIFLFASIGIGLLIGVFARDQSVSVMLSMIVFMPSMLLSGIMFPASMLPKAFRLLGRIFPASHALVSFDGFAYHMKTDGSAALSLCVVAGIGLLTVLLAVLRLRNFRKAERL